ncbi:MAG: type 4a pilus biogenesis protein PilO [Terriglobales bacterium]
MAKFTEMPKAAQLGIVVFLLVAVSAALYFLYYKSIAEQNRAALTKLKAKQRDVETLRPFEKNLPELDRQIAALKQQLEIQKHIVPDEKEADEFMHMIQNTATTAGIEIRRYKAESGVAREFYTEVPFALELDGSYYSMVNFFDKLAKLERIINVANLQVSSIKSGGGKYKYSPGESVLGSCTATTFFSHDAPAKPAAPAKPGAKKK